MTDRSKAVLLLWFILIVSVRPLSVSFWLFVHFVEDSLVAICSEEMSYWLFACVVLHFLL